MKTTFLKVITTDYLSFVCALFSVMFIVLGPGVLLVWVFAIPIIISRVGMIKKTLENGETVKATITKQWRFKHGSRLKYKFDVNGKTYEVGNYVQPKRFSFQVGDKVEVVYSTANPQKAFIAELYKK